jgi:cytochrome c
LPRSIVWQWWIRRSHETHDHHFCELGPDLDPGELFERRCSGCHSLDKDKEGPRLRGVYGRAAASVSGFEYSDALKASHITWDAATLDKWLADPEQVVPANDMSFRLVKPDERAAIIDYLRESR